MVAGDGSLVWGRVLPPCSSSDIGKALAVNNNSDPEWSFLIPLHDTSIDENGDAGKVLMVLDNGETGWRENPGLPAWGCASNIGKLLMVCENGPEWQEVIPSYDSHDSGKLLSVTSLGELSWGSAFPSYDTSSVSNSDEGKALTVSDSGRLEWSLVIPSYDTSGSDEGKFLVISDNAPSWEEYEAVPPFVANMGLDTGIVAYDTMQGVHWVPCANSGRYVLTSSGGVFMWDDSVFS
jgi:hypothetical protein